MGGVIVVLLAVALAIWIWRDEAERRALVGLPPAERAELYRKELGGFRDLCGQGERGDALQRQCTDKAKFLLEFPECDDVCKKLARSHIDAGRR